MLPQTSQCYSTNESGQNISSLTEQNTLKHDIEGSGLCDKDIACHYHGDDGYAKACNESQIEMMKDPLENSAQEKKK